VKTLIVALLLCLPAGAQTSWLCREDVKDAFRRIYSQTAKDNREHGFRVDPDTVEINAPNSEGEDHVSIHVERGKTIAIVHTHPEGQGQTPSPADRAIARRTGIPVVVLGMETKKITIATPDGDVVWLAFFWDGRPASCKAARK
jgi:hypothetical protein